MSSRLPVHVSAPRYRGKELFRIFPCHSGGGDPPQRQQGWQSEKGGQPEHRTAGQIRADAAHHPGGKAVADRGKRRVAAKPLAERGVSDKAKTDRRDRRRDDATGDAVEDLGHCHRQPGRQHCHHQGRANDGDDPGCGRDPLSAHRIDHGAGRDLADHRGDGAQAERQADLDLGPFMGGQIDGDEGAEACLHVGEEEVEQVECPQAALHRK